MARLSLLLLFLLTTSALGTGVVWDRTYDFGGSGTEFYCVQETSDSNFVVAGKIAFYSDARVLLFDGNGNHIWSSEYGISGRTYWVEEVPSGGYVATGLGYPPAMRETNLLLMRVDASGDTLWSKQFGSTQEDEIGYCVTNFLGGFIICGTRGWDEDERMWVLRTDENGDTLWTRTILEGCDETFGQSLAIDFDGNIIAAGYAALSTSTRPILAKLSPDGDLIWFRRYTEPFVGGFASAVSVVALSNGDYCFASTIWLFRTDNNGDSLWVQEYSFPSDINNFRSMDKTMDGGFVCAGYVGSPPYVTDYGWVVKATSTGELEWQSGSYGSLFTDDRFASVRETSDGGYICAGKSDTDGWLVRLEPEVGIEEPEPSPVTSLSVSPNPFTSSLSIDYSLPEPGKIELSVYDLTGRLVASLESGSLPSGEHLSAWSPGPDIPDGCYLLVVDACGYRVVSRCILLR